MALRSKMLYISTHITGFANNKGMVMGFAYTSRVAPLCSASATGNLAALKALKLLLDHMAQTFITEATIRVSY